MIAAALLGCAPVAVLVRPVERGEIVNATDVEAQERSAGESRGAASPDLPGGMEATRRLPAGHLLQKGDLALPRLVRRGATVTLLIRGSALSITTVGRALSDGRQGERVRVVAAATGRTLEGVVDAAGAVRINSN